jgi:hypothetical protein
MCIFHLPNLHANLSSALCLPDFLVVSDYRATGSGSNGLKKVQPDQVYGMSHAHVEPARRLSARQARRQFV